MEMNQNLTDIGSFQLTGIYYYIASIPRYFTEETVRILNNNGVNVSNRWVGTLLAFISISLIYIGVKISQKPLKYILIGISIILLTGLFIPGW